MRRVARAVTAVFVVGSAGVGFVPLAQAAPQEQTLVPSVEAWYQPDLTCEQATGCVIGTPPVAPPTAPPPASPYPSGTLHIGWASATETARAYLSFPLTGVGRVSAATLDVPLDTAPADGDTQSSTAKVQACLVSGDIVKVEGSFLQPPAVSCKQHATLVYKDTPAPHLTGDLTPLLSGLADASGIALLPDALANTGTDAWRVVLSAHDRVDAAKTPPVTLTVTSDDVEDVTTFDASPPPVASPDLDGAVATPDLGTALAPGPSLPEAVAVPPPTTTQPVSNAVPQASTVRFGFQYPAVFLLPLVMLVLVPLAARALTRDLEPQPLEPSA
jgi:hypothetical protein